MDYKTFIRKANRRIKREIFSRLYLDLGKEKDFILVLGSGRSGTTWLADAISQAFDYRLIFEPFWNLHIDVNGERDFFHHRYISTEDDMSDNHIKYVMSGKYKNMRTNMNYRYGPFRGRVIKDICSSLFIEKILQIFPQAPIIFVIRHPCAVVLSRLKKTRWSAPWGWHAYLFNNQKDLIEKYFNNKQFIPKDELEDHAITYCYENYLPLLIGNENINFVYYEKLVLDIRSEMEKILSYIEKRGNKGRCIDSLQKIKIKYLIISPESKLSLMKSRVRHLYSWRNDLDERDIERIKKIVRQFGLKYVYEEIEDLVRQ
jgi:hypothetical protein